MTPSRAKKPKPVDEAGKAPAFLHLIVRQPSAQSVQYELAARDHQQSIGKTEKEAL
jgi:hypothetical protein